MPLAGRHVVLGVSGGIACYKSCTLARRLTDAGATVDVVLTAGAAEFVRPLSFEALTGRPVLTSLWAPDRALAHISLAKQPDLVILAPATANLLARAAMGLADDILTSLLIARTGPVLCAPAMNDAMYAHPATQANLATLRERGWKFVGPDTGPTWAGAQAAERTADQAHRGLMAGERRGVLVGVLGGQARRAGAAGGATLRHRERRGVGAALQLGPLLVELAHVDHQGTQAQADTDGRTEVTTGPRRCRSGHSGIRRRLIGCRLIR